MANPKAIIEIDIQGLEQLDKIKDVLEKYNELSKHLVTLATIGVDIKIIEDILKAVKPIYQTK